jgi:hypothetical protein
MEQYYIDRKNYEILIKQMIENYRVKLSELKQFDIDNGIEMEINCETDNDIEQIEKCEETEIDCETEDTEIVYETSSDTENQ